MSELFDNARMLRWCGRLGDLTPRDRRALFDRSLNTDPTIRERTSDIVRRVRDDGDTALRALALAFDGVSLDSLEVPRAAWQDALDALDPALRRSMERALTNLEHAHRTFLPVAQETESEPGITVGRRPDPLARVGVYAPGGRAAYPSSVLMGIVPARVAGVEEIVLCSPPDSATSRPANVVLAAAALAGADRVFALGGAGAIAAMAFGTSSVPRVDRIVGPGNAYVAEAKLQVASVVGIDSPAGPSELLVLCDASADPVLVAREMLAQAEHDPLAAVVALVDDERIAQRVVAELSAQLPAQPRAAIAAAALAGQGGVLVVSDLNEGIAAANAYAAEHLLLLVTEPDAAFARLRAAGTVFIGAHSSVAFGDYMTGANHVLPTGGLARSYSGLSTLDFMRWTTWQRVSAAAAARLAGDVGVFADAEGLPGHAAAARAWRAGGRS
jgi:histidinol dehydrogenase